jgi:hypothetical protein
MRKPVFLGKAARRKESMKKVEALQMGCQIAAGVLANPVAASRIFNGMYDVQASVRECTQMVIDMACEMGISLEEDAPQETM